MHQYFCLNIRINGVSRIHRNTEIKFLEELMSLKANLRKFQHYLKKNFSGGQLYNHINGVSIESKSGKTINEAKATKIHGHGLSA